VEVEEVLYSLFEGGGGPVGGEFLEGGGILEGGGPGGGGKFEGGGGPGGGGLFEGGGGPVGGGVMKTEGGGPGGGRSDGGPGGGGAVLGGGGPPPSLVPIMEDLGLDCVPTVLLRVPNPTPCTDVKLALLNPLPGGGGGASEGAR